jgi:hypothetical protein
MAALTPGQERAVADAITAPPPGPREAAALQALERARREDALDASLPPCRVCGGKAVRYNHHGGESTGGGYVSVRCERGDQEHRIGMDGPKDTHPYTRVPRYWRWEEAEAEVLRRWKALNAATPQDPRPVPVELMETRAGEGLRIGKGVKRVIVSVTTRGPCGFSLGMDEVEILIDKLRAVAAFRSGAVD